MNRWGCAFRACRHEKHDVYCTPLKSRGGRLSGGYLGRLGEAPRSLPGVRFLLVALLADAKGQTGGRCLRIAVITAAVRRTNGWFVGALTTASSERQVEETTDGRFR